MLPNAGASRRRRGLPPALGLITWVILLPLCLMGLGLCQLQRGTETASEYAQLKARLPNVIERARQAAAPKPGQRPDFVDAPMLRARFDLKRFEDALPAVNRDAGLARARPPAAWAVILGAGLALVAGLIGLMLSFVAGIAARRSRDWLVRGFAVIRGLLPFLLGFQLLGLAVCALAATAFEASGLWFTDHLSGNAIKLAGAGIVLAAVAAYGALLAVRGLRQVFALQSPDPIDVNGRLVTEADAPGLWRFVRELARRQDSLVPDVIAVGLTEGFFVTEAPVRLLPEDSVLEGRTLYLPAPFFGLLDGREFAAIIGHELAHFSGQDTVYSRRFAPIYRGLRRALMALQRDETNTFVLLPAIRLGFHAVETFDAAVGRWSQLRELEADKRGATVAGADAAASALLRTSVVAPVIGAGLQQAFEGAARAQPDIVAEIGRLADARGFGEARAHLDDRQPHPTDSHPPDRMRIEALGVTVDGSLLAHASRRPGQAERDLPVSFFSDWPGLCRQLSGAFLADAERHHAAETAFLQDAASAVSMEATQLHENGRVMAWTMGVLVVIMAAFGACIVLFARQIGIGYDPRAQQIILSVLAAIIALATLYGWWMLRRSASPFLILTPDGFASPYLRDSVVWTDVEAYRVTAGRSLTLALKLVDEAPLPRAAARFRARLDRRKRILSLNTMGARGLKAQAYADLIGRYIDAARARTALAEKSGR
ncbi:M48 family metallopeptidase [Methylobacterium sp. C25]|uniref:M48 family metallopeptidase n=1 Tax=Methylobacterium sp. C25 TaxID=2721622 RepID=UPI001F35A920|nr:M48 family metallopeptidase [Methylobacterium sp. C25]